MRGAGKRYFPGRVWGRGEAARAFRFVSAHQFSIRFACQASPPGRNATSLNNSYHFEGGGFAGVFRSKTRPDFARGAK